MSDFPEYPGRSDIRAAAIFLENPTIGDGRFVPELAKTLRAYADMIDKRTAGIDAVEQWTSPGGTRLFILGGSYYGDRIPRQERPEKFEL